MERTTTDEVFACLPQFYIGADDFYDVGSFFDFLDEIRVKFFSWGDDCSHASPPFRAMNESSFAEIHRMNRLQEAQCRDASPGLRPAPVRGGEVSPQ